MGLKDDLKEKFDEYALLEKGLAKFGKTLQKKLADAKDFIDVEVDRLAKQRDLTSALIELGKAQQAYHLKNSYMIMEITFQKLTLQEVVGYVDYRQAEGSGIKRIPFTNLDSAKKATTNPPTLT